MDKPLGEAGVTTLALLSIVGGLLAIIGTVILVGS